MTADKDLYAKDFSDDMGETIAPRLSFFNACETGIDKSTLGKGEWAAYSWADALAGQGGMAFIGTLWPVYEQEALIFSSRFYKGFLGVGERTLAESIRHARLEVKKLGENKEYEWLAYILYGAPSNDKDDILYAHI